MLYKKTLILSSLDNSNKKAVVNLNKESKVNGTVKLYNFVDEPMGDLTLAILINQTVIKTELKRVSYMQYSFLSSLQEIPNVCTCAVVSSQNGQAEPLLLGSIINNKTLEDLLVQNLSLLKETSTTKIQEQLDCTLGDYEDSADIEKEIDRCMGKKIETKECKTCLNCQNCTYKNAFYDVVEEVKEKTLSDELKKDIIAGKMRVPSKNLSVNFIDEIAGQIDMLFASYPAETALEDIIPNSKWVKIDFNGDKKYYVVGLIYENDVIKYICYGIPGHWAEFPPTDFNEKAQWLAIDLDAPHGEGYWITYQDAGNGDLINVNII